MKQPELNIENFPRCVARRKGYAAVDFSASWCHPCEAMAPTFFRLVEALPNLDTFGVVDMAVSPTIAQAYGVRAVPSIVVFRNGRAVATIAGHVSFDDLRTRVLRAMESERTSQ